MSLILLHRYASQLIIASQILAQKRKASVMELRDFKEAYGLFVDVGRSQKYIEEQEKIFMFSGTDAQKETTDSMDMS